MRMRCPLLVEVAQMGKGIPSVPGSISGHSVWKKVTRDKEGRPGWWKGTWYTCELLLLVHSSVCPSIQGSITRFTVVEGCSPVWWATWREAITQGMVLSHIGLLIRCCWGSLFCSSQSPRHRIKPIFLPYIQRVHRVSGCVDDRVDRRATIPVLSV